MKLIAHIDIEQEINPASFGTVREPIALALVDALTDLEIPHVHGTAVVAHATVTIEEASA